MRRLNILAVDDHRLFLEGLVSLLQSHHHFKAVTNASEAFDEIRKAEYDVCLLDIGMPETDGLQALKVIKQIRPEQKVLVLSMYSEQEIVTELVKHGVSGYVLKNSSKEELLLALGKVSEGNYYFSDEVQKNIVNGFSDILKSPKSDALLTPREVEVVRLLAKEYTNDRIAQALHISFRTVETHRKNIMQKTKAHNLAGLLKFAYLNGILEQTTSPRLRGN
jgi:two-component system, NarL family, nitrate/nitrite response regulator NarL